jgi:hypothetical protein
MGSFHNMKTGMEILKRTLTQLLLYYTRHTHSLYLFLSLCRTLSLSLELALSLSPLIYFSFSLSLSLSGFEILQRTAPSLLHQVYYTRSLAGSLSLSSSFVLALL